MDGLGAKTIRADPANELVAGVLVAGTPYAAAYNAAQGVFYLHGVFGNPYNIPVGGSIDFWGGSAPNSAFALMYGQAISRTAYSTLFSMVGTTYGTGDGSTTFNIPDLRGRVTAGKDDMGGVAASRLTASVTGVPNGAVLGAVGGTQDHTLTTAQLASHSHGVTDPGHTHQYTQIYRAGFEANGNGVGISASSQTANTTSSATGISIQSSGSGNAHNNVQPTIITNKLIRII